mmetsp:Transcript_124650/g.248798  ORF Transcript_124650/g.248798 Transcript_124650/m.248798 type:complete len:273 (+) Transcript_124650:65-883(+)
MGVGSSHSCRLVALSAAGVLLAAAMLRSAGRVHGKQAEGGHSEIDNKVKSTDNADRAGVALSTAAPLSPAKARRVGPSSQAREWASQLVAAAGKGNVDVVLQQLREAQEDLQELLAVDASMDDWTNLTGIGAAALGGHAHVLEALLQAGANPDVRCINATSWDGAMMLTKRDTPMCIAAQGGHKECVQALLNGRADPNIHCHSEFLEGAAEWGDSDDGSDMIYYSALDAANTARHPAIAELIRQSGGRELAEDEARERPARMKVSSGSRMGA